MVGNTHHPQNFEKMGRSVARLQRNWLGRFVCPVKNGILESIFGKILKFAIPLQKLHSS